MDNIIERIEDGDYTAAIIADEYPSNPRDEYDQVGLLVQLNTREYAQPAATDWRTDALVEAWQRRHDLEIVERFARAFLGAVAVASWDDPVRLVAHLRDDRPRGRGARAANGPGCGPAGRARGVRRVLMSRTVRAVALARAVLSALFPSRAERLAQAGAVELIRAEVWPANREHLRPTR